MDKDRQPQPGQVANPFWHKAGVTPTIPGQTAREVWQAEAVRQNVTFSNIIAAAEELGILEFIDESGVVQWVSPDHVLALDEDDPIPYMTRVRSNKRIN